MTFTEIVAEIQARLGTASTDAATRIGRLVNMKYRQLTAEGWLQVSRRIVSTTANTTEGLATVTFTGVEKLERVVDAHTGSSYTLEEITLDDLRLVEPIASDSPRRYAIQSMGKSTVTIRLDVLPQSVFELKADGLANASTLSGSQEPAFPESFHDILVEAVLVDEYKRLHQVDLSVMSKAVYDERLSGLKMFLAKSSSLAFRQGGRVHDPNSGRGPVSGGGGGGTAPSGSVSYTQTALISFDRDPDPPFGVASGSAKVANLDADLLDGKHESEFADIDEAETVTGLWTFNRGTSAPFAVSNSSAAAVTNLDADKLDGSHGDAYAKLADDETVTGQWAFTGDGPPVTISGGGSDPRLRLVNTDGSVTWDLTAATDGQFRLTEVGVASWVRVDKTTGVVNLDSGKLKFPAAQSASSDANTLDDYEEGGFTPAVTFGGGSTGVTYTTQSGHYVKVGKNVFFKVAVTLSAKGSSTGGAVVSGLPFTEGDGVIGVASVGLLSGFTGLTGAVGAYVTASGTSITLVQQGATGTTQLTDTSFTDTTTFYVSGWYRAAN